INSINNKVLINFLLWKSVKASPVSSLLSAAINSEVEEGLDALIVFNKIVASSFFGKLNDSIKTSGVISLKEIFEFEENSFLTGKPIGSREILNSCKSVMLLDGNSSPAKSFFESRIIA